MRISRKRKRPEIKVVYKHNEKIDAPVVMVLSSDGSNLGEMKTTDAIKMAHEKDMDLVEINPKSNPPVVKILEFGQFQYQQEKEARIKKARQKVVGTKGVRLSLRIGRHDMDIRKKQALKFLNNGDKVKVELILKGRENQQGKLAFDQVNKFTQEINAEVPTRTEQEPERQGNKVTSIIVKT